MTLADRLKTSRKNKGYTQKDLARLLSVKPATISAWEVGRNEPSIEMLKKIADIFGVSFEYLAGVKSKISDDREPLTENQKLVAYSIDPDISDEERQAIIEMVQAAKKFRKRI